MPKIPEQYDEMDTGPLTQEQLQGLARDQLDALRNTAQELWLKYHVRSEAWLFDRLEFQLCGVDQDA